MFEILKRQEMADGTVVLNEISAPLIAKKAKPGQFVILKANETGERIPLTMADTDPKKGLLVGRWLLSLKPDRVVVSEIKEGTAAVLLKEAGVELILAKNPADTEKPQIQQ